MKITLELEAIQSAFETISKTAAPSSGNITFTSAKGKVTLTSVADLSRCQVVVPCEVDKEGEFAVPMQSVRDAVKGRSKLTLTYANAVLTVSSGAYKASLNTVDVIPLDELAEEKTTDWKLTADQAAWLRKALRDVALKPTTILSSWMPAGIRLTSKGAFVVCYDTQHMSWVTSKEVTGDFECVLPIDVVQAVVEVFHKSNFVISQGKAHIQVRNKTVKIALNVPSTEDLPTLEQVQEKIKEATKVKADTFVFAKSDMLTFLDNAKAVLGKERAELSVEHTGKGIELVTKTVQGQVKNTVKGTGKGAFKIDLDYIQELVTKAGDEITLNVVASSFLSLKLASSTAIVALNQ